MFHVEHSWNSLWEGGRQNQAQCSTWNITRGGIPPWKQVFNSLTNPGRNSHFNFVCLFSLLRTQIKWITFLGTETHLLLGWFYFLSSVCCP
jgi:hypothetical protein